MYKIDIIQCFDNTFFIIRYYDIMQQFQQYLDNDIFVQYDFINISLLIEIHKIIGII